MHDVNKVMLVGRLGKDPQVRRTASGKTVANVSLATGRRVKKGEGWDTHTEWHRIVVWEKQAEIVADRLRKGDPVAVVGELRYGEYTDKTGQKRHTSDVVAQSVSYFTARLDQPASIPERAQVEEQPPF